jgi:hypothetical protein
MFDSHISHRSSGKANAVHADVELKRGRMTPAGRKDICCQICIIAFAK